MYTYLGHNVFQAEWEQIIIVTPKEKQYVSNKWMYICLNMKEYYVYESKSPQKVNGVSWRA